ncbi:unnamed protein product, partial [Durusdinium trenchii]
LTGEDVDPQAADLVGVLDNFSAAVNENISVMSASIARVQHDDQVVTLRKTVVQREKLRVPPGELQKLQQRIQQLEALLALAEREKALFRDQAMACAAAVDGIRGEAVTFRDKLYAEARNLCEFHVQSRDATMRQHSFEMSKMQDMLKKEKQQHTEAVNKEVTRLLEAELKKIESAMKETVREKDAQFDQHRRLHAGRLTEAQQALNAEAARANAAVAELQNLQSQTNGVSVRYQELSERLQHETEQARVLRDQLTAVAVYMLAKDDHGECVLWSGGRRDYFDEIVDNVLMSDDA